MHKKKLPRVTILSQNGTADPEHVENVKLSRAQYSNCQAKLFSLPKIVSNQSRIEARISFDWTTKCAKRSNTRSTISLPQQKKSHFPSLANTSLMERELARDCVQWQDNINQPQWAESISSSTHWFIFTIATIFHETNTKKLLFLDFIHVCDMKTMYIPLCICTSFCFQNFCKLGWEATFVCHKIYLNCCVVRTSLFTVIFAKYALTSFMRTLWHQRKIKVVPTTTRNQSYTWFGGSGELEASFLCVFRTNVWRLLKNSWPADKNTFAFLVQGVKWKDKTKEESRIQSKKTTLEDARLFWRFVFQDCRHIVRVQMSDSTLGLSPLRYTLGVPRRKSQGTPLDATPQKLPPDDRLPSGVLVQIASPTGRTRTHRTRDLWSHLMQPHRNCHQMTGPPRSFWAKQRKNRGTDVKGKWGPQWNRTIDTWHPRSNAHKPKSSNNENYKIQISRSQKTEHKCKLVVPLRNARMQLRISNSICQRCVCRNIFPKFSNFVIHAWKTKSENENDTLVGQKIWKQKKKKKDFWTNERHVLSRWLLMKQATT